MDAEMRREYNSNYYKNNKEKLSKKSSEKIQCPCGAFIVRAAYSKHRDSIKHAKNIKEKAADALLHNQEISKLIDKKVEKRFKELKKQLNNN